jgi:hypothetical protein
MAGFGGEVRRPTLVWITGAVSEEGMVVRRITPAAREPMHRDLQRFVGVEVAAVSFPAVEG